MKKIKVYNVTKDRVLLQEVEIADSFLLRLKGLLGRKGVSPGKGIIIKPCNAVHTLGMSFPIDVVFVDKEDHICRLIEGMLPNRFSPVVKEALYVVEGPAGFGGQAGAQEGDKLKWVEV
ncbi:MAG: DUF192 domain-containing protein [Candidatus Syntrophonatronum acetioxidans]|uniref:DUF192 domain-containing protein n=1 Tax=Candidatus Syntrophonatronum acetioxidans TaxID=1795816 RepID=A0A424YF42_9FIRM|nr:MAG: DUF192 domain-containing protein [Candidatus Syntrophonatronum acetioxidans]